MKEWRNSRKNLVISNSKKIHCLSGWGQKFDSLENIFSESFFVSSFDYSKLSCVADFFSALELQKTNPEVLVGWSLGGQLAIRLIEKKILQPKLLILIAPPFQMIKNSRVQAGMSPKTFDEFYKNFSLAPTKTLKQFAILTSMNDRNAKEIADNLDVSEENFEHLKLWLKELERFSCFDVDFSEMPRTLYFHGAGDMIVHASQAEYFCKRIKNMRFELFKNCGHAPHLSDPELFKKIIYEEILRIE
jgi:pimeloyl-[acyl-carrier protein] methyl ester esterase